MMGWQGNGGYGMMLNGNFGIGYLVVIFWLIILFDLVLLGIFLWKKIAKNK